MNRTLAPSVLGLVILLGCADIEAIPESAKAGIPTICEVTAHPGEFQNKEIRIQGIYFSASEASAIGNQQCGWKTWVEFDPTVRTNSPPGAFEKLLNLSRDGDQKVEVILAGRLSGPRQSKVSVGPTKKLGYGHLNAYEFEFKVTTISKIGRPYSAYQ